MSGTAGTVAAGAVAVAAGVTGAVTVTGAVATGVTGAVAAGAVAVAITGAVATGVTGAPGATTTVGPVGVAEESLSPPSSFLLTLLRREVGEYDSA